MSNTSPQSALNIRSWSRKVRLKHRNGRPTLWSHNRFLHKLESKDAELLAEQLRDAGAFHERLYGISGTCPSHMAFLCSKHVLSGGNLGLCDVETFFKKLDLPKLRSELMKYGVPAELARRKFHTKQRRLSIEGLPQGMATSSPLAALIGSLLIRKLDEKGYTVLLYVDDLAVQLKPGQTLDSFLQAWDQVIAENFYRWQKLSFSMKPNKAPRVVSSNTDFEFLGLYFSNGHIVTKPGTDPGYFYQTLKKYYRYASKPHEGGQLNEIESKIVNYIGQIFVPLTGSLQKGFLDQNRGGPSTRKPMAGYSELQKLTWPDSKTTIPGGLQPELRNLIPRYWPYDWVTRAHTPLIETPTLKVGDPGNQYYHLHDIRENLRRTTRGSFESALLNDGTAADDDVDQVVSTFSDAQKTLRLSFLRDLNQDYTTPNKLYKAWRANIVPTAIGSRPKQPYPQKDDQTWDQDSILNALILELHYRLVLFAPVDTLTNTFTRVKGPYADQEIRWAKRLLLNELRWIDWYPKIVCNAVDPSITEVPRLVIQQLLRASAYRRFMQIAFGFDKSYFPSTALTGIGTFVWTVHLDLTLIAAKVRALRLGAITRAEFKSEIDRLRESMKPLVRMGNNI